GTTLAVRGQISTMENSFYRLGLGMAFAVILVYLLMAVNFQSWLDPFIILMALPGAMAGIVWILFLTQTTFSVPSLMGAIMCVGVATANSILLVVFANDQREEGMDARSAALSSGHTRIRPVLMTAGVVLMLMGALGLGGYFFGYLPRTRREQVLAAEARAEVQALPVVNVERVQRSSGQSSLVMPGNIQAVAEAPVLARATGYVSKRNV